MLRRAASSLSARAASFPRRLPPSTSTAAATASPPAQPRLIPPLPRLGVAGAARGYARMARRVPPSRPDGYSTSDGESDELGGVHSDDEEVEEMHLEPMADEDVAAGKEWEGFMLEYNSNSDSDSGEDAADEGDK